MSNNNQIAVIPESTVPGFATAGSFDLIQRQAKMFSQSALVPKDYQGNLANCVIALEMANRMGLNPLMVMQSLYMVHGRPAWAATFVIAAINGCGRYNSLHYDVTGTGDDRTCIAWAIEKESGERVDSPPCSIGMAKKEGWFSKNGSKWQTMPDLMLRYRCATWFGRLYAPEILMGMRTAEELEDTGGIIDVTPKVTAAAVMEQLSTINNAGEIPITPAEIVEVTPPDPAPVVEPPKTTPTDKCETCGYKPPRHAPTCPHHPNFAASVSGKPEPVICVHCNTPKGADGICHNMNCEMGEPE